MATPIPPEDFTSWTAGSSGVGAPTVTGGFADPDGGTNAYRVVFPAVTSGQESYLSTPLRFGIYDSAEPFINTATTFSVWLKADATATTNMWIYDGQTSYGLVKQITVTTSWQFFSFTANSPRLVRRCALGCSMFVPGSIPIAAQTLYVYHGTADTAVPDLLNGLVGFYSFNGNTLDSSGANNMSQKTVNLTSTLGGYWALDGNANDSTGTNNGTASNLGSYTAGKISQCATFNGSNSRISIANPANFRSTQFTVAAWTKTSNTNRQEIFQSWDQQFAYNGFEFAIDNGSIVATWGYGGSFANFPTAGIGLSDGNWHHVAMTYDGTTIRMFKDGALVHSATSSAPVFASTTRVNIGINEYLPSTFAYPFNGNIDEVGYWSTAKNEFEIKALYNAGSGLAYPLTTADTTLTYVSGLASAQAGHLVGQQRFDIANPANFRTTELSVAGWIRMRPKAGSQFLLSSWHSATSAGYRLAVDSTGRLLVEFGNSGGGSFASQSISAVANGQWHHVAVIYSKERADYRLYVDGIEEAFASTSGLTFNSSTTPSFGYLPYTASSDFVGDVQNWGYWNRAIALQEVQALFNFGQGLMYPFNIGGGALPINLLSTTGSNKLVTLSFDATPVLTGNSLLPNNWTTSPELSISNATVVGDSILLTTSEQTTGKLYTLNVPSGISSQDGLLWTGPFTQTFTGVGQGPSILNIYCIDARTIDVSFSEEVYEPDALTKENYSINNGLQVFKVVKVSKTTYRLTTSKQAVGTSYTVTASNIRDIYGNIG